MLKDLKLQIFPDKTIKYLGMTDRKWVCGRFEDLLFNIV